MNIFGTDMDAKIPTWDRSQRRMGSLLAIGVVALLVLVALITYAFAREKAIALYWVFVVLVVLVLVYEILVLVLGSRSDRAQPTAQAEDAMMAAAPAPRAAAPAPVPNYDSPTLTLRCGDCGTVFEVTDTGDRPLYHKCPGCDAEGVLRDLPPLDAPAPSPEPAPAYEPPAYAPTPVAVVPTPAAIKRVKLRCGGCKQVFAIDDAGERPMRSVCPHCGRKGEIK